MHWIQLHILDQLMRHKTRRFSELRAEGVESNLFQYHLRHTMQKGFVEKSGDVYQLAPAGLYYADRYSPAYKGERLQPKLITVAVLRNQQGEVLMQEKPRQPWVGSLHLPAGKIHIGEAADEAARREVNEKTGMQVDSVAFRSVAQILIYKDGIIVSNLMAFIFAAVVDQDTGRGTWFSESGCASVELAPGVRELLEAERIGDAGFHMTRIDVA